VSANLVSTGSRLLHRPLLFVDDAEWTKSMTESPNPAWYWKNQSVISINISGSAAASARTAIFVLAASA